MFNTNYLLLMPLLLFPFNLSANAMIPSFMLVWPLAWLVFIPIVFIEALVMRRFLKQESFIKLLLLNTVSNGASTFIGLPIAFLGYGLLLALPTQVILRVMHFPWWLSVAVLVLCILSLFPVFFFVSVWIERWIMHKFLHAKYETVAIAQAVKVANIASYIFLLVALVIVWLGSAYYPEVFQIFSFW